MAPSPKRTWLKRVNNFDLSPLSSKVRIPYYLYGFIKGNMRKISLFVLVALGFALSMACKESAPAAPNASASGSGVKIAYVNGDSILLHYKDFRKESEAIEAKQKKAEEELQNKGAALEKEIMAYQQKAKTGTMTGKEMEARERYLSSKQEEILAERDRMAQAIMQETGEINKRLQAVLHEKLKAIKESQGYDFILSYVEGGPVLVADEKYDITEAVLKELNDEASASTPADSTAKK